jgi:hypothetical protein
LPQLDLRPRSGVGEQGVRLRQGPKDGLGKPFSTPIDPRWATDWATAEETIPFHCLAHPSALAGYRSSSRRSTPVPPSLGGRSQQRVLPVLGRVRPSTTGTRTSRTPKPGSRGLHRARRVRQPRPFPRPPAVPRWGSPPLADVDRGRPRRLVLGDPDAGREHLLPDFPLPLVEPCPRSLALSPKAAPAYDGLEVRV